MEVSSFYKTGHGISYKIAYAPSEDSDHPAHPRSLIRVFTGHSLVGSQGSRRLKADIEDSDQTVSTRREV